MIEEISIKDVYTKMAKVEGYLEIISKLAPVINENEKNIIRLYDKDEDLQHRMERVEGDVNDMKGNFEESQKQNQKILIAIGVIAILGNVIATVYL